MKRQRNAKAVVIAGRHFGSFTEVRRHVEAAIATGVIDRDFVLDLVMQRHPFPRNVIDPGVDAIDVEANSYGSPSLLVRRMDGTQMFLRRRWLWDTRFQVIADAARQEAFGETFEFKRSQFAHGEQRQCAGCSRPIVWDSCDVDHGPPLTFAQIVRRFVEAHGDLPLAAKSRTYDAAVFLRDSDRAAFLDEHRHSASLRLLCRDCNRTGVFGR